MQHASTHLSIQAFVFGMLVFFLGPEARSAPPAIEMKHSAALTEQLKLVESMLEANEPLARVQIEKSERALASIRRLMGIYFHAPNRLNRDAREAVLSMRKVVHRAMSAHKSIVVVRRDVIHFAPRIHAKLASSWAHLGVLDSEKQHLLALLAVEPKRKGVMERLKKLTQPSKQAESDESH